jgi:hypothetical protein
VNARPEQIDVRRDGTVQVWFDEEKPTPLDGSYFIRGAICWPGETTRSAFEENMAGFAVLAGVKAGAAEVGRQTIEIFAEHVFSTMGNVVEGGRLAAFGLAPWMDRALGDWGCRLWYAGRGETRMDAFLRDVRRGGLEAAKAARFIAVDETLEACIGMLVDAQNERRLRYAAGGDVHQALRDYKASEGNVVSPAMAATARLCAGIRRRPPRARGEGWLENFRAD